MLSSIHDTQEQRTILSTNTLYYKKNSEQATNSEKATLPARTTQKNKKNNIAPLPTALEQERERQVKEGVIFEFPPARKILWDRTCTIITILVRWSVVVFNSVVTEETRGHSVYLFTNTSIL